MEGSGARNRGDTERRHVNMRAVQYNGTCLDVNRAFCGREQELE